MTRADELVERIASDANELAPLSAARKACIELVYGEHGLSFVDAEKMLR